MAVIRRFDHQLGVYMLVIRDAAVRAGVRRGSQNRQLQGNAVLPVYDILLQGIEHHDRADDNDGQNKQRNRYKAPPFAPAFIDFFRSDCHLAASAVIRFPSP